MRLIRQSEAELPTGDDVYAIVKNVWQNSIEVTEKLLAGESYRTSTSEPLLALAAWHLYPDMTILGMNTADVLQEDELFRSGGILTIGMAISGSLSEKGITWSLPLSHLRFYGKPITKTRSLGLDTERVYFDDLKYLVLGAVTGNWFNKSGGLLRVIDFLDALVSCLRSRPSQDSLVEIPALLDASLQSQEQAPEAVPPWLDLLWRAASDIRDARGQLRSDQERLYKLGHRRGLQFLSLSRLSIPEVFGLTNFDAFIAQFVDYEEKIKKARRVLPKVISNTSLLEDGFISYRIFNEPPQDIHREAAVDPNDNQHWHSSHADSLEGPFEISQEFATIVPAPWHQGQHQRRVPSNHSDGAWDGFPLRTTRQVFTWEVPYMISPHSGQVKRCSALSESANEMFGLYNFKRKFSSGLSSLGSTALEIKPPFSTPPPEIIQTSSSDWTKRIEAAHSANGQSAKMLIGIGSDGSLARNVPSPSPPSFRQSKSSLQFPLWVNLRKTSTFGC